MVAIADESLPDLQAQESRVPLDNAADSKDAKNSNLQAQETAATNGAPASNPPKVAAPSAPGKRTATFFGRKIGLFAALGIGSIPILTIVVAVAALLWLAGFLKIPNLAANITEYEFGSLARQVNDNVNRVVDEKLAVDSTDDNLFKQIQAKYKGLQDGFDEKFLQKFSPSAAIRVLQTNQYTHLRLNYNDPSVIEGLLGRQSLQSIELNGKTFVVPAQRGFFRGFIPKILDIPYLRQQIDFVANFSPTLADALGTSGAGGIPATTLRNGLSNQLRQELGINLIAWIAGRYKASTLMNNWEEKGAPANDKNLADAARLETENEAYNEIHNSFALDVGIPDIKDQAQQAADTVKEEVQDPKKLEQDIKNGGVSQDVANQLEHTVGNSALNNVVSFVNPVYGIALPACIIYEGSLEKSGPNINASMRSQEAAFYAISSAADQLKAGTPNSSDALAYDRAIGGWNDKLADTTQSIPYQRAAGLPYNTDTVMIHPEAGADQTYTLIDATPGLGGNGVGDAIKAIASNPHVCPTLTDIRVGIAGAVASVILDVVTADTSGAGEAVVDTGIQAFLKSLGTRLGRAFIGDTITKGIVAAKLRGYVLKFAGDALRLTFMTVAAKLLVLARSGEFFNGLEQGADFANEGDSGGMMQAGEICRTQQGCRAMTCSEQAVNAPIDNQYLASINASRSVTDRYFALSNPDSLIDRLAISTASTVAALGQQPAIQIIGNVLSSMATSIVGTFVGVAHAADTNCASQNYGNVRFGWSADENKLIDSNDSYLPLENQQILGQSGKESEIAQTYAKCFGYTYDDSGTSFDPTDPNSKLQMDLAGNSDATLGMLLANGDIVRTASGDVSTDQGTCSPQSLSYQNPAYGDLVFRFRLSLAYEASLKQVTDLQTVAQQ